jgi:hypothetical protein
VELIPPPDIIIAAIITITNVVSNSFMHSPLSFSFVIHLLLLLKILVLDLILFKMGKIQNWPNNYKVSLLKKKSKSKSNVVVSKIQLIDILKKKDNNIKLYIITHLILIFFLFQMK